MVLSVLTKNKMMELEIDRDGSFNGVLSREGLSKH
jgi:hypothetical protein